MHAGTIAILSLTATAISLWLLFNVAGFIILPSQTAEQSSDRYYTRQRVANVLTSAGIVFGIMAVVFTLVGGIALTVFGVSSYSCRLVAQDLSMEYDHSWIRKCRVEVTLEDNRVVWINPSNVRLTEDFRLAVTDPQP